MTQELATIVDFIRYGASRFGAAGLTFGHSYDNALDESTHLVLHALHLPHDLSPAYGSARLTADEKRVVFDLIERRIAEHKPVAYLTGEAWFAGLKFKSDARALVPRSPIAELIQSGFVPWLDERPVERALDLCTGSGCIGIAMAAHNPDWRVDLADISDDALSLARELRVELDPALESVRALGSLIDPNVHSCGTVRPHGEAGAIHRQRQHVHHDPRRLPRAGSRAARARAGAGSGVRRERRAGGGARGVRVRASQEQPRRRDESGRMQGLDPNLRGERLSLLALPRREEPEGDRCPC